MNKQTLSLSSAVFSFAAFFMLVAPINAQHAAPASAQDPAPVKIANTLAQPVPVIPVQEPFTATCNTFGTCNFVLPEGKRLVIESVTGNANLSPGATWIVRMSTTYASGAQLNNGSSGWSVTMPTTTLFSNGVFTFVAMNNKTYLLARAAFGSVLQVVNVGGGGNSTVETVVSGYLIPTA